LEFMRVWNYLYWSKISGDYLEFGVFEGRTFNLAMRTAKLVYSRNGAVRPRFFAFDSFRGLPNPHPKHDAKGVFSKGEYKASVDYFKRNIRRTSKSWEVRIIPGLFNTSLTPHLRSQYELTSASFVTIDCDLYESTRDVLKFITPIICSGTMLYFDDWYTSGGGHDTWRSGCMSCVAKKPSGYHPCRFWKCGHSWEALYC